MKAMHESDPILRVDDLRVRFPSPRGMVVANDGVSYDVKPGEMLALVGESGSGKSVSTKAVLGLLSGPPGTEIEGSIRYGQQELLGLRPRAIRALRGEDISIVFQDALSALNPTMRVGQQLSEIFRVRRGLDRRAARTAALELLDRVQIPAASSRLDSYPHEFSGGMRQRVMIASAIALNPSVLLADEPTTALDVTVQSQIMALLRDLQQDGNMAIVLVTHDLGVVSETADRIAVMYAGRIVETGPTSDVLRAAAHPYTRGLLRSLPAAHAAGQPLVPIEGTPPDLATRHRGCSFAPRCPDATDRCLVDDPDLLPVQQSTSIRLSACHYRQDIKDRSAPSARLLSE